MDTRTSNLGVRDHAQDIADQVAHEYKWTLRNQDVWRRWPWPEMIVFAAGVIVGFFLLRILG